MYPDPAAVCSGAALPIPDPFFEIFFVHSETHRFKFKVISSQLSSLSEVCRSPGICNLKRFSHQDRPISNISFHFCFEVKYYAYAYAYILKQPFCRLFFSTRRLRNGAFSRRLLSDRPSATAAGAHRGGGGGARRKLRSAGRPGSAPPPTPPDRSLPGMGRTLGGNPAPVPCRYRLPYPQPFQPKSFLGY